MTKFADLGFRRLYDVEVNPEFPGTGPWPFRSLDFGDKGRDTLTIKVRPEDADQWVASFALEDRGFITGVFSCPNPHHLLVATGIDAFLLQADRPSAVKPLPVHPIRAVERPQGTNLVLVESFTGLLALDESGLRWAASHLLLDDLELLNCSAEVVRIRGRDAYSPAKTTMIALDATTGHVLATE